jgi:hypothetical protein
LPLTHALVQHSTPVVHVAPGFLHAEVGLPQTPPAPPSSISQFCEQQSRLPVQFWPVSLHVAPSTESQASAVAPLSGMSEPSPLAEPSPVAAPPSGGASPEGSLPQPTNTTFAASAAPTSKAAAKETFLIRPPDDVMMTGQLARYQIAAARTLILVGPPR